MAQDLIGNVWQYTDEFVDAHTRYVLVRGGCNYRPKDTTGFTSDWYFPQAKQLDQHNKCHATQGRTLWARPTPCTSPSVHC